VCITAVEPTLENGVHLPKLSPKKGKMDSGERGEVLFW